VRIGHLHSITVNVGEFLCLIKTVNTKAAHVELTCSQSKGDPGEKVYWNETGTEVKMGSEALKIANNEGKEEGSGLITTSTQTPTNELEMMT
jgi:hypothetical protein